MYSIVGILAVIMLFITNRDIFFHATVRFPELGQVHSLDPESELEKKLQLERLPRSQQDLPRRRYRLFLCGVLGFYLTDALWGILFALGLPRCLFVDTSLFFFVMALAILFWTRYVISYLDTAKNFGKLVYVFGVVFLVLELAAVVVNLFRPVLFWFDADGSYHAGSLRYATFGLQGLMFLLIALHILYVGGVSEGAISRHYLAIGLFGMAMVVFITVQLFFPMLPLYAMGYMIGTCLIHSFVVEDEKEVYREELEKALDRERKQLEDLKEGRKALRAALTVAQKASKAKTAFLSNMSHEIRTPMNAIIGLNSIAMEEPSISVAVKEHLVKINSSAHHLLDIINDILDMTRIESGSLEIKNEDFSLADCMVYVNNIIGSQCRSKGLAYEYRAAEGVEGWYCGDAVKLKQVLINILGNSVKFTPEGGTIRLLIEKKSRFNGQATLVFTIADTGIGISEEFLPHIFDAFSKEDLSMTTKYGSTGLGMAITKSIVNHMNGQIDVKSKKGKGTTFTVTLTLAESDKGGANGGRAKSASGTKPVDGARLDGAAKASDAKSIVPEEERLADLTGRHVLLAEDMEINADIVVMMLKRHNVEADVAQNGKMAVQLYMDHPEGYYDAILMDMRMPEMDGLEATQHIRASGRADAARIPIVALTANAFEEDVKRSMQAGLNAHLSKPVEPELLFHTLGRLIHTEESGGKA